jgi:anti-sigma regulatory factor (Ser/Thr protein kinase)
VANIYSTLSIIKHPRPRATSEDHAPTSTQHTRPAHHERHLPGSTEHIRTVRADLRRLLHDCPMADDVILCASELAANAAIHSNSRLPSGTFTVRATISPGQYTWIEVEDNRAPWAPATNDPTRHHGLDIVRTLADDCGIDGDHTTRHLGKIQLARPPVTRPVKIERPIDERRCLAPHMRGGQAEAVRSRVTK